MGIRKNDAIRALSDHHLTLEPTFLPRRCAYSRSGPLVAPSPLTLPNLDSIKSAYLALPTVTFKKDLLSLQIGVRLPRKAIQGLDKGELKPITRSTKSMHKDIAPLFNKMWDEIWKAFKSRKNATAKDKIDIASAYRSAKEDEIAWENAYRKKYYQATWWDRRQTGDEFGLEALRVIFQHMNGKKAPPGYSGHTHGIAVDFTTTEDGKKWAVNSNYEHQVGWQKTWLYQWLVDNAWKHNFYQLKTETWHWEYHADGPTNQCWGGQVTKRPVIKPKR